MPLRHGIKEPKEIIFIQKMIYNHYFNGKMGFFFPVKLANLGFNLCKKILPFCPCHFKLIRF
jgi:hypothetical protein